MHPICLEPFKYKTMIEISWNINFLTWMLITKHFILTLKHGSFLEGGRQIKIYLGNLYKMFNKLEMLYFTSTYLYCPHPSWPIKSSFTVMRVCPLKITCTLYRLCICSVCVFLKLFCKKSLCLNILGRFSL